MTSDPKTNGDRKADEKEPPFTVAIAPMYETFALSYTKLKRYLECPAAYYHSYDKKAASEAAPVLDSGKLVHRVLELAGRKRIDTNTRDQKVTKKELLGLLDSVLKEVSPNDWERPIDASPEVIDSARSVLSVCWKRLDFRNVIEVEKPFDISIGRIEDHFGYPIVRRASLTGVIDRIDRMPNGVIRIIDYKTGWSITSRAEAELDPQVNLYLAIATLLFPGKTVEFELRYIAYGARLGPFHVDEARREWLLEGFVKPNIVRMLTWKEHPEKPGSPQCLSCFRKAECKSFAAMMGGTLAPITADMGRNLALFHRIKEIKSNAEALEKKLKPIINDACENADDGELFAGNFRASLGFRNRTEYQDIRRTATAGAKAIIEARNATTPPPEPPVIPTDHAELAKAYAELAERNRKLEAAALEAATAFEVACKIAKPQAGLVNEFVDGLPNEISDQVGEAIGATATNSGFYMLEVEPIPVPFHEAQPSPAEQEIAAHQRKLSDADKTALAPMIETVRSWIPPSDLFHVKDAVLRELRNPRPLFELGSKPVPQPPAPVAQAKAAQAAPQTIQATVEQAKSDTKPVTAVAVKIAAPATKTPPAQIAMDKPVEQASLFPAPAPAGPPAVTPNVR
jgi:RecB family exonuclease